MQVYTEYLTLYPLYILAIIRVDLIYCDIAERQHPVCHKLHDDEVVYQTAVDTCKLESGYVTMVKTAGDLTHLSETRYFSMLAEEKLEN